ncbi:MAG: glucose-6-phosphate isomerase [Desulfovibrio sp.]|jgi:glucose-6-phosphate isomerase|nr:glucose-6-phosphate isomerase [Desulfovibrio sp.]
MSHCIEWSRAYAHRLPKNAGEPFFSRRKEISERLARELAAGKLPFLDMPYREKLREDMLPLLPRIKPFRHMLLLGIGGSALGARAFQRAFAPGQDEPDHAGPWLWIADNVCPGSFEALLGKLRPADTVVVCVSKSGGTIETLAQYFLAKEWLLAARGERWREHMVVVTDRTKGYLREESLRHGLLSLEVPNFLGGRYSALSAVGLLPAAFLGIDWEALLDGARDVALPLARNPASLGLHPSFALACWAKALEEHHYSQLIFFCYIPSWAAYGLWFAQLWAESLGKGGKGIMPVPAVGVTDQHSVNQMFLDGRRDKGCLFLTSRSRPRCRGFGENLPEQWSWLAGKPFSDLLEAEALGTRMALAASGVPLVHLDMEDDGPRDAGALMMLLEAATVFTGWLMDINPLDQPAVELGKRLANARLGAKSYPEEEAGLAAFLAEPRREQMF